MTTNQLKIRLQHHNYTFRVLSKKKKKEIGKKADNRNGV